MEKKRSNRILIKSLELKIMMIKLFLH